jgi:hypothetical protein
MTEPDFAFACPNGLRVERGPLPRPATPAPPGSLVSFGSFFLASDGSDVGDFFADLPYSDSLSMSASSVSCRAPTLFRAFGVDVLAQLRQFLDTHSIQINLCHFGPPPTCVFYAPGRQGAQDGAPISPRVVFLR